MTNQTCTCGKPTAGSWLCGDCELTFRWALANVSAHYHDLATVEAKQARYGTTGTTKGSIGKTQPLPVDTRFAGTKETGTQLKYDTWATVVAWTRAVMEDQPQRLGPRCLTACLHLSCAAIRTNAWPANTVTSMVNYLARQFRYVLSQRWCADMMDEFLDLERRLTRMVNRPAERWYAGRCGFSDENGTCETELYATASKGTIECPGCGVTHDVGERREFLLTEAKDVLVTATEAAAALLAWTDYDGTTKKVIDLIAYWRDHKTEPLDVADVTSLHGRDRHLYRLGDVQDRLIEHAQREQQRRIQPLTAS